MHTAQPHEITEFCSLSVEIGSHINFSSYYGLKPGRKTA